MSWLTTIEMLVQYNRKFSNDITSTAPDGFAKAIMFQAIITDCLFVNFKTVVETVLSQLVLKGKEKQQDTEFSLWTEFCQNILSVMLKVWCRFADIRILYIDFIYKVIKWPVFWQLLPTTVIMQKLSLQVTDTFFRTLEHTHIRARTNVLDLDFKVKSYHFNVITYPSCKYFIKSEKVCLYLNKWWKYADLCKYDTDQF